MSNRHSRSNDGHLQHEHLNGADAQFCCSISKLLLRLEGGLEDSLRGSHHDAPEGGIDSCCYIFRDLHASVRVSLEPLLRLLDYLEVGGVGREDDAVQDSLKLLLCSP